MRIYICDDCRTDREALKKYIFTYFNEQNLDFTIEEMNSAKALITAFQESKTEPTLLFLDILMSEINGINAAKQLYSQGFTGSLIFTTDSADYAVESYNLGADDYLKKPYSYSRFTRTMERCRKKWEDKLKFITVLSDRLEFRILLQKIHCIESMDHACIIHTDGSSIRTRRPLNQLEADLSGEPCFIRCGRSYIININHITISEDDRFLRLKSGMKIPIPARDRTSIPSLIAEYCWMKTRGEGDFYG